MKLLIVGDFKNNTGPANVNKSLIESNKNILYTTQIGVMSRIIELIIKMYKSDVVIFSGISKINIIGFKLAKIFRKKSAYLMHGYYKMESKINLDYDEKWAKVEDKILKIAPKIICVSKTFSDIIIEKNKIYRNKIDYIETPINVKNDIFFPEINRENNLIMSVGGGSSNKNIIKLCETIEYLNEEENKDYRLLVIGKKGKDTEKIKKYNFVEYIENVPKDKMEIYYRRSRLYIQNSEIESFGLSTVESVMYGCNLIISKNVGSKNIFENITQENIINDTNNLFEISDKIKYNMKLKNSSLKIKNEFFNYNVIEEIEKIMLRGKI